MPYDDRLTSEALLHALAALAYAGNEFVSSKQLAETTGSSLPAVKRMLSRLVERGQVEVTGKARATRYRLPTKPAPLTAGAAHFPWRRGGCDLIRTPGIP